MEMHKKPRPYPSGGLAMACILMLAAAAAAGDSPDLPAAGGQTREVALANRWVQRVFLAGPVWRTTAFRARGCEEELAAWNGPADEGSITVEGKRLVLGGDGPEDLGLAGHSLRRAGRSRQQLRVRFEAQAPAYRGLAAVVTYDLLDDAPVLVKAMRPENRGSHTITPWLGGLSLAPPEKNADLYSTHFANALECGFDGMPSGDILWDGPRGVGWCVLEGRSVQHKGG